LGSPFKYDDSNGSVDEIRQYVEKSSGLSFIDKDEFVFRIQQKVDSKVLVFSCDTVEEVIHREDTDGQPFLQVNFLDGRKVLLTEKLVGFKPAQRTGIEMDKLPKVVTTPDLVSVVEAIEDSLSGNEQQEKEVEVLKRVFDAVLEGGEAVGFDLKSEREWIRRLTHLNASA
jgi:hypothetical protein